MNDNSTSLPGYRVVIRLPVQWGDQDAFGHVNNTVYMRWMESSRIAYLERIGLGHDLEAQAVGPILAAIACDYRRQLTFPDDVVIGAKVTRIGRSSLTMVHAIHSVRQAALVAEGRSTVVAFDYRANRPRPVPEEFREAIRELEGDALDEADGGLPPKA